MAAEVVGLAASIIQIAGAGIKLSSTLYNFVGSATRADSKVSDIADDVKLTANALDSVGRVFEREGGNCVVSKKAIQDAESLIKRCEVVFAEIQQVVDKRRKVYKDGKKLTTLGRFSWPLKEQRVELLRRRLESLKNSLVLFLHVVQLANEQARGNLEKNALDQERERIRELHQRQQDSLRALQALENKLSNVSLSDDETLHSSAAPSRIPTIDFMVNTSNSTEPLATKVDVFTTPHPTPTLAALPDDSETSESDGTATDNEGEHMTVQELAQCTAHVQKLLKRISTLQQSFEATTSTATSNHRYPKHRVHKLYRRFCRKFESEIVPCGSIEVASTAFLPEFVPPSKEQDMMTKNEERPMSVQAPRPQPGDSRDDSWVESPNQPRKSSDGRTAVFETDSRSDASSHESSRISNLNGPETGAEQTSQDAAPVHYTKTGRISKAKKGLKVHNCSHCEKSFTRAEHLRRHQKNHDQQKVYCDLCGKDFYRSDLLQRHYERHKDSDYNWRTASTTPVIATDVSVQKAEGSPTARLPSPKSVRATNLPAPPQSTRRTSNEHRRITEEPQSLDLSMPLMQAAVCSLDPSRHYATRGLDSPNSVHTNNSDQGNRYSISALLSSTDSTQAGSESGNQSGGTVVSSPLPDSSVIPPPPPLREHAWTFINSTRNLPRPLSRPPPVSEERPTPADMPRSQPYSVGKAPLEDPKEPRSRSNPPEDIGDTRQWISHLRKGTESRINESEKGASNNFDSPQTYIRSSSFPKSPLSHDAPLRGAAFRTSGSTLPEKRTSTLYGPSSNSSDDDMTPIYARQSVQSRPIVQDAGHRSPTTGILHKLVQEAGPDKQLEQQRQDRKDFFERYWARPQEPIAEANRAETQLKGSPPMTQALKVTTIHTLKPNSAGPGLDPQAQNACIASSAHSPPPITTPTLRSGRKSDGMPTNVAVEKDTSGQDVEPKSTRIWLPVQTPTSAHMLPDQGYLRGLPGVGFGISTQVPVAKEGSDSLPPKIPQETPTSVPANTTPLPNWSPTNNAVNYPHDYLLNPKSQRTQRRMYKSALELKREGSAERHNAGLAVPPVKRRKHAGDIMPGPHFESREDGFANKSEMLIQVEQSVKEEKDIVDVLLEQWTVPVY